MENVKASTNAEQQHESKVDEEENFDTFIKAMVQIVTSTILFRTSAGK